MTTARPGPREMARRQRNVRAASVVLVFGLIVQAGSFLEPGLWRFLAFLSLGATLVIAGAALAALAMFAPTKPAPPAPAPAPPPAELDEMGPT